MIKIEIMKYLVTKEIQQTEDGVGAKVGDILTVGWYDDPDCEIGCWALFKDNKYVCDLGSHCGTHNCEELKPEV